MRGTFNIKTNRILMVALTVYTMNQYVTSLQLTNWYTTIKHNHMFTAYRRVAHFGPAGQSLDYKT